jgi:YVTN family beta-propeller protein
MQLTAFNGFAVVDFATRKEIARISNPALPPGKKPYPPGNEVSHGMAITPDHNILVVCSRINSALYFYSLPDLKVLGAADLEGKGSGWVSISPDGRRAYVANTTTDDVSVVDIKSMKEVARIPVGPTPKRNIAAMLP